MQFSWVFQYGQETWYCVAITIYIYKRSFSNNVLNPWYSEQIFYIGKLEDHTSKQTLPTTIILSA